MINKDNGFWDPPFGRTGKPRMTLADKYPLREDPPSILISDTCLNHKYPLHEDPPFGRIPFRAQAGKPGMTLGSRIV
jgi:hypothetical protein